MVTIIFAAVVVLCVCVVILAFNVIKENRKMAPGMEEEDDDELLFRG